MRGSVEVGPVLGWAAALAASVLVAALVALACAWTLPYLLHAELAKYERLAAELSARVAEFCGWCNERWPETPKCCSGASCASCCVRYHREVLGANVSWDECYSLCVTAERLSKAVREFKTGPAVTLLSMGFAVAAFVETLQALATRFVKHRLS